MSDVILEMLPAAGVGAPAVETPSAAIIKDANRVVTITDVRGRQLSIKNAQDGLKTFRLTRLLGADGAANTYLMAQAKLYTSVVAINGDPTGCEPTTMLGLEALIARLDEDGLNAIFKGQLKHFGAGGTQDEVAAEAKGS